jgi:hypothetical protein
MKTIKILILLIGLFVLSGLYSDRLKNESKNKQGVKKFWGSNKHSSECFMHQKKVCEEKYVFWILVKNECEEVVCS